MNDFKFKVTCYLTGYGSWTITVNEGSWDANGRIYTIVVKNGQSGNSPIVNKTYRFPVESTVIEENK